MRTVPYLYRADTRSRADQLCGNGDKFFGQAEYTAELVGSCPSLSAIMQHLNSDAATERIPCEILSVASDAFEYFAVWAEP